MTNSRGSWVVGESRGPWVWVWVKVVGEIKFKKHYKKLKMMMKTNEWYGEVKIKNAKAERQNVFF